VDIRPALEREQRAVISLWQETGLTRPWNDPVDEFTTATEGEQMVVLVAADEDGLRGTVLVADDGHRGWIYLLAVDPSLQGTGLGHDLVTAAEEWLRARGQLKLRLMVRNENSKVLGFYEALGYADQDVRVLGKTLES
jgi:ribosomal protein S18 acetylase RimI-like enzyme